MATIDAASRSATAPDAITWSVPSSGTSQNAVAKVPTMLPAVEMAKRRPAIVPSRSIERAASRTATGVADARTTLAGPNRIVAASSGSSRGPASHETTRSTTRSSRTGTASTSTEPSASTEMNRYGVGQRSASTPPAQ